MTRGETAGDADSLREILDRPPMGRHLLPLCLPTENADRVSLLEQHRSGVYRFLRARGLNPDDADDLTQETLVRAYRYPPAKVPEKLSTWLCAIAKNAQVDCWRRRRYLPTVPLDDLPADYSVTGPEARTAGDAAAELAALMAQLNENAEQAVRLRYFEGLSLSEIGKVLHCSPSAAKLRVFRAVAALRRLATTNCSSPDGHSHSPDATVRSRGRR